MNIVSRCSGVKTAYKLKESIKKAPFARMVLFLTVTASKK